VKNLILPIEIEDLHPPISHAKIRYSKVVKTNYNLSFQYFGGMHLTLPEVYTNLYSKEFGRLLSGGTFSLIAFAAELAKNFGNKLNPLQSGDVDAEWVAFEKGLLFDCRNWKIGPLLYDHVKSYSLLVSPNKLRIATKSIAVVILHVDLDVNHDYAADRLVRLKVMAEASGIKNLIDILQATGVPRI
jgi:hypothetical protein